MEEADRHEAKGSQHLPVALQKLDLSAWATGKRLNEAGPGANSKLGMLHLTHCFEGEGQILYTLLSERKLGGIVMYSASLRRLVAYIHLGLTAALFCGNSRVQTDVPFRELFKKSQECI
jgi:hypothetical protein